MNPLRALFPLILALLLPGPLLAVAEPDVERLRIGVPGERVDQYNRLAEYLNEQMRGEAFSGDKDSGDDSPQQDRLQIEVEFVAAGSYRSLQDRLRDGELEGAIVSPYRYVMLAAYNPGLGVIGRLVRGGTEVLARRDRLPAPIPDAPAIKYRGCDAARLEAQESYQGVLITKVNEDTWPLRAGGDNDIRLGVRSPQSTSSFLFPAEFLQRTLAKAVPGSGEKISIKQLDGWRELAATDALDDQAWTAGADHGSGDSRDERMQGADPQLQEALSSLDSRTRHALAVAIKDYQLVTELRDEPSEINFAGISSHWLKAYSGERSFFRVIWQSPHIPYDPVIIKDSVPSNTAAEFQRALLSTQTIKPGQRDWLFPVIAYPVKEPGEGNNTQVICRRSPDIYSFIAAKDSDYDLVRRTAVRLSGGIEIDLALSTDAHWAWRRDEAYFEELKSLLVNPRQTFGDSGSDAANMSIYLNYTLRNQSFPYLASALRRGDYDIAELNAGEAGRLTYEKSASLLGSAIYRDGRIRHGSTDRAPDLEDEREYRMVLLYHGEDETSVTDFVSKIDTSCVAVAREDVSSVKRYAMYYFDTIRQTPIPEGRLKEVDGARGVARALIDYSGRAAGEDGDPQVDEVCGSSSGGARFGLLAEYEYLNLERELGSQSGLHAIPVDEFPIPNAMLLFSRRYAPFDEDLQEDRSFSQARLRALVERDMLSISPIEAENRRKALRKLKRAIKVSRDSHIKLAPGDTGFLGIVPADKSGALKMAQVHGDSAKNYIALIIGALVLIVVGTGILVWRAYLGSDHNQFLIDKLQLGGDEKIQQFIHRAIAVRNWLKASESDPKILGIYGGESVIQELAVELDTRIVTLVGFYKAQPSTADYAGYLRALTSLVEYMGETMKPVETYEQDHEVRGRPGEETGESSDYSEVIGKTVQVTLELTKALSGRG